MFVLFISISGQACCIDVGTSDTVMPKSNVGDRNFTIIESTESTPINQCPCTNNNIWIDVYFLIDSSRAMTANGFDEATSFAEAVLYKLNIGQADGQRTRAGFISYFADASKNYDLTAFKSSNDMIDRADFTYNGSRGTNIESAIKLAAESFETSSHRSNVQKVIVIIGSAYENGNYNDPTKVAKSFTQDGGFIITVVNCFCPTNYLPFMQGDVRPTGGCYKAFSDSAIQTLAAKNCRQYHDAYLVKVESRAKSQFLSAVFPSKTKFWIGLKYLAATGLYQWSDGTYLGSSDFQMWAPGYPNANAGYCVYMYQYTEFRLLSGELRLGGRVRNGKAFVKNLLPQHQSRKEAPHICQNYQ
ncbi:unnamed protein product [Cylicocyclus nassatus]|uniref:VWFA domain-containing protein n=1 Tax=Cylicocyclus nassatus TaxID=53992 RepID=A0AA36GRV5_CYLNA|nr:unnamed protein product [Cylicocyclus nassatus]